MTSPSKASSSRGPFHSLPVQTRVASIRYSLNWQGIALQLQYDRLTARDILQDELAESVIREHMSGVIDMDFLVVVVRRVMRLAQQAKGSKLDTSGYLKPIIADFEARWSHVIGARNTLEHIDEPKASRALIPVQSSGGERLFLMPGNSIDIHELFKDADNLCRVIGKVIRPYESETFTPEPSLPIGADRAGEDHCQEWRLRHPKDAPQARS